MANFACALYVTGAQDTIIQNLGAANFASPVGILCQYLVRTATTTPAGFIYSGDVSEVEKLVDYLQSVFAKK